MSALKSSAERAAPGGDGLHCCMCCGRDTRSKFQICARCLRGSRRTSALRPSGPTAEDDYSEESGPDSVYREHDPANQHEMER